MRKLDWLCAFMCRMFAFSVVFAMMESYAYKEFGIDSVAIEIGGFFAAMSWSAANYLEREK
jgi:hypothetical protein